MVCKSYECQLDPETDTILKIYLFKNVKNVEFIRNEIIKGVWNCAAIKPYFIVNPMQIAVAANKATLAAYKGMLVTRSVYSEILYNLSLTKNITTSLNQFGIDDKTTVMFICFLVKKSEKDCSEDVIAQIQGEECLLSDLKNYTDFDEVNSLYKLKNIKGSTEDLLDIIISRIVTKSFVSH